MERRRLDVAAGTPPERLGLGALDDVLERGRGRSTSGSPRCAMTSRPAAVASTSSRTFPTATRSAALIVGAPPEGVPEGVPEHDPGRAGEPTFGRPGSPAADAG